MEKIESSISSLTSKQQLIAVSILQDPLFVSFSSVKDFANKIGVSPASIVRFAQQITDGGYPQLQAELQAHIQDISNPIKRLDLNVITNSEDAILLSRVYETHLDNLRKTFNQNLITSVGQAAKLIYQAEHIYTTGSRGSYAVAYYLGHHLNRVFNNADPIPDNDRLPDFVRRVTERDVVFLVCLPRYSQHLLTVAKKLRSTGAKIITINESPKSPFVPYSDVSIFTSNRSNDFHNSLLSSILVVEMLISLVISNNVSDARGNLDKMEPLFTIGWASLLPQYH
jgi:DNA-binding MurR/RpiR family transcriptional regulator